MKLPCHYGFKGAILALRPTICAFTLYFGYRADYNNL
jgi:hypothetical protein